MPSFNLLYRKQYRINDDIQIVVPTVGEVIENEDAYYGLVSMLTSMPYDFMVQLDDAGIDFSEINDYELFLMLFPSIQAQDTSLIFGDLDLDNFQMATNNQNGTIVLWNQKTNAVIDRAIHGQITYVLRKIHHLEKNLRKPANGEVKEYLIQRARDKQRRQRNRVEDSYLESLIIAMVNTEQYKYDFERTKELSIYQFNESVRQVVQKVDYQNKMYGVYTGNINVNDLNQNDLNWLTHK